MAKQKKRQARSTNQNSAQTSSSSKNVTRIKAGSSTKPSETVKPSQKSAQVTKEISKKDRRSAKSTDQTEKPLKQVFILARPFVAIGRYLRDSWRELRLVRWPSRGNTWKMTLAVLVYCAIFIIFIILIDSLFTFIFNLLIGQ